MLQVQTAVCLTESGRPRDAVDAYRRVLNTAVAGVRDRAYVQMLMATSLALSGEPDEAAGIGSAALPAAITARSRRTIREAGALTVALRPWQQRPAVRSLAELLATAS